MEKAIKFIDARINFPWAIKKAETVLSAEKAMEAEKTGGRGGLLTLFQGMANRQKDMTPEELVAEMDAAGIEKGVLSLNADDEREKVADALKKYPGKFVRESRTSHVQNRPQSVSRGPRSAWPARS